MKEITNTQKIQEILDQSGRLKYFLHNVYKVAPQEIKNLCIDPEKFTLEIQVREQSLIFRARGTQNVLRPLENDLNASQIFNDPAFCKNIMEIVHYFGE